MVVYWQNKRTFKPYVQKRRDLVQMRLLPATGSDGFRATPVFYNSSVAVPKTSGDRVKMKMCSADLPD